MIPADPDGGTRRAEILAFVREVQSSVLAAADDDFNPSLTDNLRSLIRITVEFHEFLHGREVERPLCDPVEYMMDTVFSGVSSFQLLHASCNAWWGAGFSRLDWTKVSIPLLKETFESLFTDFLEENNFETRCKLLLDLFKIQIVLAGMLY
jgi:hypothetical protein